jgi:molybdopterin synthase catalytic subunit
VNETQYTIAVHAADFDPADLQRSLLTQDGKEGAVVAFTGYVRADNSGKAVQVLELELEHYPGMTEKSIQQIVEEAFSRWPLIKAAVVHRVGRLAVGDQIVWVGVSSAHREAAYEACAFIMDFLKTRAPFWKKEHGAEGSQWVDARESDLVRADKWRT